MQTYAPPPLTSAQLLQQTRTDVVRSSPIECSCRFHAGSCTVERFADGSMRHVEILPEPWGDDLKAQTRVYVMTDTGMRYR